MGATTERLLQEAMDIGVESSGPSDLLKRLGSKMKEALGADALVVKEVYQKEEKLTQSEEAAVNTRKPYLDNRLSSYSAFDLINYFNVGYRSCLILPVSTERTAFGVITLLSAKEERFDPARMETVSTISSMLSYELDAKVEREKSLSMARYFDAVFENQAQQFIVDREGRIVKANKFALNSLGLTPKEVSGKDFGNFFSIGDDAIKKLRSGVAVEMARGNVPYSATAKPISESLAHVLLYDLTGIRELEAKTGLIGLSKSEVFILLDSEMKIVWVGGNAGALRVDAEAVLGRRLPALIKDRGGEFEARLKAANDAYNDYISMEVGNGIEIAVDIVASKVGSSYGVMISRDMDRYVESLEKNLDDFFGLSPDFVISIDESGYIRRANKSAETLLKYRSGELDGVPVSAICTEAESLGRMNSALDLARDRGIVTDLYMNLSCKDGEAAPFTQSVKAMRNANGAIDGFVFVGKELSTKKLIESLKADVESVGKQAEKMKGESDLKTQFIFNVSHELRTPITNINGYSKLLLEGGFGALNEEQKESVRTIISEADRLMQLIQQVLDVAKLSSGKIKLDIQKVSLKELAENPSIKSLAEMAANKGLEFSFNVNYDVPEAVDADPNRLIQVFVNLIVNAYKFTEKGGIAVKAMKKGKSVRIEVQDTGVGISAEEKAKIFRKFYQIQSQRKGLTKPEGTGTGLGLSIVREIVNLHGGKVGVTSAPGKGSIFWFTIPIHYKPKRKGQQDN